MKAMLIAVTGFSFYSFGDAVNKMGGLIYDPIQVTFFVQALSLLCLVCVSPKFGGLVKPFQSKNLKLILFRSFIVTGNMYFCIQGYLQLGMAKTYTLLFIAPFLTVLLSVIFMKEIIHGHRWAAIAAGFTGVLIVLRPGLIPLEPAAVGVLFAALTFAASSVIVRRIGSGEPIFTMLFFNALWMTAVFGTIMLWKGYDFLPELRHIPYFIASCIFLFSGNYCFFKAFSMAESSTVAPFHYIQLLWGVLFGYLVFDTAIDFWTATGGAIIVASGLYMIHREHVRHRDITHGVVSTGTLPE
jgi:drug/metabolite transporter (DMT)-like permease